MFTHPDPEIDSSHLPNRFGCLLRRASLVLVAGSIPLYRINRIPYHASSTSRTSDLHSSPLPTRCAPVKISSYTRKLTQRTAQMGYFCTKCERTWPTRSGFYAHLRRLHQNRKPPSPGLVYSHHPKLNGLPCDRDGNFLDEGAPPPPRPMPLPTDWTPFENRPAFHFAEFAFEKTRMSTEDLNEQLRLWQAYNLLTGNESTMYNSVKDVLTTIDQIPLGDLPWTSFNVRYTGPVNDNSPSWMHQVYTVHMRDTFAVQTNLLKNQDFAGAFDYVPYRAYSQDGRRHWSNLMSGQWSWKQADEIAQDPNTHGSMLCPIILGADKTTVSVATGNSEFHPVYMSTGNLHNTMRRGHCDAVVPVAFLAIPKEDEILWSAFGIDPNITPFASNFPRADIYELLSPDLLHQMIKGTFKDHLITWIEQYVRKSHSGAAAQQVMDDIDRRIAAVPSFPGLRRFPEGRRFKQWTGNDSKGLMKVIVPAIVGHVPDDMVRCVVAFLDFCYLARRSSHTLEDFTRMEDSLRRFHQLRLVFTAYGIRPNDFSLPRQHALSHYIPGIRLFGSPNGLCSSITESKHITAVKKPWRSSSRHNSLKQMLDINVRMSKISAARIDFGHRGMLHGDVLSAARIEIGQPVENGDVPIEVAYEQRYNFGAEFDDEDDVEDDDGPAVDVYTRLAVKHGNMYVITREPRPSASLSKLHRVMSALSL
ncbi:hypothetical protein NLI96_g12866 [Meripilus lineatus]|uniref:C2H2-type domain-containing protein n=1 Tax=Meripilus lineatus TaxID=2056292 RepID=A0AAD5UP51_9APHY|nr:hypothetical protein NLI96_g12866 [Physisporinus lineatus]